MDGGWRVEGGWRAGGGQGGPAGEKALGCPPSGCGVGGCHARGCKARLVGSRYRWVPPTPSACGGLPPLVRFDGGVSHGESGYLVAGE